MSYTIKVEIPGPTRSYYVGGMPTVKQAYQMRRVKGCLDKGERIGLGATDIEQWLQAFERSYGFRPTAEPLGNMKGFYILTKP